MLARGLRERTGGPKALGIRHCCRCWEVIVPDLTKAYPVVMPKSETST